MTIDRLALPADAIPGEGNCGVTALAVASGKSLSDAREACRFARKVLTGCEPGGRWRGGTTLAEREVAADLLGIKWNEVNPPRSMTLKTWVRNHSKRDRLYIVTLCGHVVTVYNGQFRDQNRRAPLWFTCRTWRRIVRCVHEVQ